MIASVISRLLVLFMLICIYNFASGLWNKERKRALIWGALFLLLCAVITVLYFIAAK